MANDHDLIPDLLKDVVEYALREEYGAARSLLAAIDRSRPVSDRKSALRLRRSKLARAAFLENLGQASSFGSYGAGTPD
jgi:hypothetical protein